MIEGKVWKYGEDINTDVIFPGKYTYTITDPAKMAEHAFEDLDPVFARKVEKGDVIVAGKNFGCGSSREQAVIALKEAGISAIISPSFARIYYRNAINQGLPVLENAKAAEYLKQGDRVKIDLENGKIIASDGKEFTFPPLPPKVMEIMEDGGLIPHLRKKSAQT